VAVLIGTFVRDEFNTYETVALPTPANAATSDMVLRFSIVMEPILLNRFNKRKKKTA